LTLVKLLNQDQSRIHVASIFSHLAASEDQGHNDFTAQQIRQFEAVSTRIQDTLSYPILRHILNTGGILNYPNAQYDMVRLGIGLHGLDPRPDYAGTLQAVATLKTVISQIRWVEKGDTIGYSRKGALAHRAKIATLAIGYADGFLRVLGNGKGKVAIRGHFVPTVGNVCMDMCFVDVTNIPDVREGDEVIIFGKILPIDQQASAMGTIAYEVLTGISGRVPRVFFED